MNSIYKFARLLAAAAIVFTAFPGRPFAQGVTDLCLKSGSTIHALRVELNNGQYIVTPRGAGGPPLKIPADQVKEIGSACQDSPLSSSAPAPTQAIQPAAPRVDPASPRFGVYGPDVIGSRLMPLLIDAYARKRGWSAVAKPTGPASQEIELSAPGASRPSAVIDLNITDSAGGFAALTDGRAAIAMATRRVGLDEAALLKARFGADPLTPASGAEHVVALDALAVIVHRDNPVKRLSFSQIAQIFSGQVVNWKDVRGWDDDGEEVSGNDGPIRLHALSAQSDGFEFFKAMVLAPANAALATEAQQHDASKQLSKAVGKDAGAIGFVEFPHISKNDALGIATACGLSDEPSKYRVKTEQYPLTRRLYLYTAGSPAQLAVREFIQFALSEEAQGAVRDAGLIDQSIEYQDTAEQRKWSAAVMSSPQMRSGILKVAGPLKNALKKQKNSGSATGMVAHIKQLASFIISDISELRRISTVFRFDLNSSQLDARALQDLKRVAGYLRSKGQAGTYFRLTGYADASGDLSRNFALSQARADQVLERLAKEGVVPASNWPGEDGDKWPRPMGFSSLVPVACDDNDEGRNKNRRVEIWIYDPGAK